MANPVYQAYGLRIASDIALPELLFSPGDGALDVLIQQSPVQTRAAKGDELVAWHLHPEALVVQCSEFGALLISGGRQISWQKSPSCGAEAFRFFILCQGLAALLNQRGALTLHGSAVGFDRGAVVFLGHSGQGKSTLAAAAYLAGAKLIADDVAVIEAAAGDTIRIHSAYPRLRLRHETVVKFEVLREAAADRVESTEKLLLNTSRYSCEPSVLKRIYILTEGNEIVARRLPSVAALAQLAEHTYWRSLVPWMGNAASHLSQCAALVAQDFVRILARPRDWSLMPAVLRAIEEDLMSATSKGSPAGAPES